MFVQFLFTLFVLMLAVVVMAGLVIVPIASMKDVTEGR